MPTTDEIREMMRERNAQLPGEWSGSIGEGHGNGGYTHWFYHPDYELETYHDPGHDHVVHLYEIQGETVDGDVDIGEYPVEHATFDTEAEAKAYAVKLMEKVSD